MFALAAVRSVGPGARRMHYVLYVRCVPTVTALASAWRAQVPADLLCRLTEQTAVVDAMGDEKHLKGNEGFVEAQSLPEVRRKLCRLGVAVEQSLLGG